MWTVMPFVMVHILAEAVDGIPRHSVARRPMKETILSKQALVPLLEIIA